MKKVGRNDPCPCGSGKKYKQCCQSKDEQAAAAPAVSVADALQAGLRHHQAGQLADAANCYRQVLQAAPQQPDALHLLGVIAHQEGKHALAEQLISQALATHASAPMLCNLGLALQAQGKTDAASECYRKAIQLQPGHVEAHYNLGNALKEQGRLDDAIDSYRRALQLRPAFTEAHSNLGNALKERGLLDAAIASYRQALALHPNHVETLSNLGLALHEQGQPEAAVECYRRALAIRPDIAAAHNNLGNALKDMGKPGAAVESYRQALAINPVFAEAHNNLGDALRTQGKLTEAIEHHRKALDLRPQFAEAYNNLGNALKDIGNIDEAAESYQRALAINPSFAAAHSNLGSALNASGRPDAAIECYRKAIAMAPSYVEAYNNLGLVLQAQEKLDAAVMQYQQALAIKPDFVDARFNLANTLHALGKPESAHDCYLQVLAARPDFAEAHCNLAITLKSLYRNVEALHHARRAAELNPGLAVAHQGVAMMLGHLSDFEHVPRHSDAALAIKPNDHDLWESRLYIYSYHPDLRAEDIHAEFVHWGDRFMVPRPDTFPSIDREPGRRLRIGYVSPDFRRHTSRFFFEPLFTHHDASQVELFAYSNVAREDQYTATFRTLFQHWRNIRGVSAADVADMVRRDRIDILVDCCNHMAGDRLDVFACKPAPLQVTWLGAAWTTGLPAVDYVLFDRFLAPEGTLAREQIVRLPGCWVAFRPPQGTAEVAPLPAEKNGHITFGYSGRTERLNHRTFSAWGEILRRLPTARLILDFAPFADPLTQDYYRDMLSRHGVDTSRVTLRRSADIFAGLGDIDILLDSFPHSGGTMLFDALWMGVPALTLASRPPLGRIGTTLMSNIGLGNWVAKSEQEYVDLAVAFASDTPSLGTIRSGMRERMRNSPLMDEPGFARGVEAAYRIMWQRWCDGQPPSPMRLEAGSAGA